MRIVIENPYIVSKVLKYPVNTNIMATKYKEAELNAYLARTASSMITALDVLYNMIIKHLNEKLDISEFWCAMRALREVKYIPLFAEKPSVVVACIIKDYYILNQHDSMSQKGYDTIFDKLDKLHLLDLYTLCIYSKSDGDVAYGW